MDIDLHILYWNEVGEQIIGYLRIARDIVNLRNQYLETDEPLKVGTLKCRDVWGNPGDEHSTVCIRLQNKTTSSHTPITTMPMEIIYLILECGILVGHKIPNKGSINAHIRDHIIELVAPMVGCKDLTVDDWYQTFEMINDKWLSSETWI